MSTIIPVASTLGFFALMLLQPMFMRDNWLDGANLRTGRNEIEKCEAGGLDNGPQIYFGDIGG